MRLRIWRHAAGSRSRHSWLQALDLLCCRPSRGVTRHYSLIQVACLLSASGFLCWSFGGTGTPPAWGSPFQASKLADRRGHRGTRLLGVAGGCWGSPRRQGWPLACFGAGSIAWPWWNSNFGWLGVGVSLNCGGPLVPDPVFEWRAIDFVDGC